MLVWTSTDPTPHAFSFSRLLIDEGTERTKFKALSLKFKIFVQSKYNDELKFEIGRFLVKFLYHHTVLLPKLTHKITALFFLFDLYSTPDKMINPFNGVIYDILVRFLACPFPPMCSLLSSDLESLHLQNEPNFLQACKRYQ